MQPRELKNKTELPPNLQIAEPSPAACDSLDRAITVWSRELSPSSEALRTYEAWLSHDEHARAARFGRPSLRERYIIGRGTLRLLLSRVLAVAPVEVPIERGRRGRPQVRGEPWIDFNVSHTHDLAVYAIGTHLPAGTRVGIDVERLDRKPDVDRLARKLLTSSERARLSTLGEHHRRVAFLSTWTCKEAMSKATGDGLIAHFGSIAVESAPAPRVVEGNAPYTPDRWTLHRAAVDDLHVVTVAIFRGDV